MAGIVGGIVGAVVLIFAVGFIIVRRMVHRNTLNFRDAGPFASAVGGQTRTAIPFPAEDEERDKFAPAVAGQNRAAINASCMANSPFLIFLSSTYCVPYVIQMGIRFSHRVRLRNIRFSFLFLLV